jgi:hypothetical protein
VRTTEHAAKPTAIRKAPRFVTLGGPLGAEGTGASKTIQGTGAPLRGLVAVPVIALCALLAVLVLSTAVAQAEAPTLISYDSFAGTAVPAGVAVSVTPALAAAPEAPLFHVESIHPERIRLRVEMYPNAPGEAGSVEALYKQSASECEGGGTVGPYRTGGHQEEETSIVIEGLLEATQYTFCVAVTTPGGTTLSAPLTLTMPPTPTSPETPEALPADPVGGRTATLHGVLNPLTARPDNELGSYHFVYRPSTSGECQGAGEIATPSTIEVGAKGEAVSASLTGLIPHTQYAFCVVAENNVGEAAVSTPPLSFTTLVAVPGVEAASVSDVAGSSATLLASVNPGGAVTSYVFEYAPAGGSFAPVPEADGKGSLPEGTAGVPVSVHVQGLQPATSYEFRVVATNSVGAATGEAVSFATQLAKGVFGLPDGRQWELVSQPDKHGANIEPIDEDSRIQAAVNGDAIAYTATAATESEPQGFSKEEQVLSSRGPDGWVSRDINPPREHVSPESVGLGEEYVAFSEDLSLAVVQPHGVFEPSLSAEASEQTAYLHTLFLHGDVNEPCVQSCYRPLVTDKQPYANDTAQPFQPFGEEGSCTGVCGPRFTGATPDLSHIALKDPSGPPPLAGGVPGEEYEWSGGQLSLGNHLPGLRVSTSEDGSWNYYVSGTSLYVSNGGVTKLIAVLSSKDYPDWSGTLERRTSRVSPDGRWFAFMSEEELTGYDNQDTEAYEQEIQYVNRNPVPVPVLVNGKPVPAHDEEVYLYHAPENLASETGTLVCASCNPTGARPVGMLYTTLSEPSRRVVSSGTDVWGGTAGTAGESDQRIAANVPGWIPYSKANSGVSIYQSRYLSDSGRLFFNSSDALVPKDVNGSEDVYEFESVGVGGCTTSTSTGSSTYVPARGGCVSLISSGQSTEESGFLDASGSGGDVFFVTAAKLAPQDYDTAFDVYDAHECTSAAPCIPASVASPPPCETGDACKPAPTPQPTIFSSPPSATFSGPGNITPAAPTPKHVTKKTVKCKKGFVKNAKGKCVRPSKKKAKKAKRASNERRASR